MTRTRSEYRLAPIPDGLPETRVEVEPPDEGRREVLAQLLLDAYRGTIDDEGEDLDDARDAIDHYLGTILRSHSVVLLEDSLLIAFSFVLTVGDVVYIDPVAVAPRHKRRGIGRAAVQASLASLRESGVEEVGATITDGNAPSERLFRSLGFVRVGAW